MSVPGKATIIATTTVAGVAITLAAIGYYSRRLFAGDEYDQAVAREAALAREQVRRARIAKITAFWQNFRRRLAILTRPGADDQDDLDDE